MATSSSTSRLSRLLRALRPTHAHSAYSATVILMIFTGLSSVFGMLRNMYIAWVFGRSMQADAFLAAFQLPDMISYFLVGGVASIPFVTILTKFQSEGREAEGQRSLSVIINTMLLVLGAAILAGEFIAPWFVHLFFNGFDPEKAALCVHLTRILLFAPLFFFAGGAFGAVLLVRKQFTIQAIAPVIYNLGTIFGGIFLVHRLGVSSLAFGTLAGTMIGPFLLNAFFARRAGTRYRLILDWRDAGMREWVKLSLPLMVGVTLVTADTWIINHFASSTDGAISLMTYAKRLFAAPIAMLAQAAGIASMPFFASLWAKKQRFEFATGVADSVSRVASLGLLAASGLIALSVPLVALIYRGGHFSANDARTCATYFVVFCLSMFLWSAQAIYSRAFYAAGNTLLPMIAGTIVTVVSWPIYGALYHAHGAMGLAFASDLGITLQTIALAALLHQRRMVSLASLDFAEMGRCLLAGLTAGGAVWFLFTFLVDLGARLLRLHLATSRVRDIVFLIVGALLWLLIAKVVLERSGSALPRVAMRRLRRG